MDGARSQTATVAESFLRGLKSRGIDHVFANAGTDFAPVIEALVRLSGTPAAVPTFLTIPHENLAMAMAHGYYLASGRPAAVMVHVTVGTGNTICALMNAYRDNVPLLLMAGRTPHTESGHAASRSAPIHWGQENFDQDGIVREYTKWSYELRAGQSPEAIVARALDVALAAPRGPVYLTLPREVLASPDTTPALALPRTDHGTPQPSTEQIAKLARLVAVAESPVFVTANLGRNVAAVTALGELAARYAIPVAENGATCVNLSATHEMHTGQAGAALLRDADLVIAVDCEVPWFPRSLSLSPQAQVAHLGIDPLFARYPIRLFPAHLSVPGDSLAALRLLGDALAAERIAAPTVEARRRYVADFRADLAARRADTLAAARHATPIRYDHLGDCLRESLPRNGLVVTELGVSADQLALDAPGSLIGVGIGGGLGFGLGASLGAKIAAPDRTVVSTIGDGSYMFGNPTPFHFVSRAAGVPTLTIICNNERWHAVDASTRVVYPDGQAASANVMPLVELKPSPEYTKVAEASDAFARRIDEPGELRGAIEAGLDAVASGRQALLDVRMEHGKR